MKLNKKFDLTRIIISALLTIALVFIEIFYGETKLGNTTIKLVIILPITLVLYILVSFDLYVKSAKNLAKRDFFNEITLTLVASIAALAVGEFVEGLAVTVFFQIGEKFENYAVNKSRDSIKAIIDLRPDTVTLYNNKIERIVDPFDVQINDLFIVKSGERVALDGVIIEGSSSLDTSSMTGESTPRKCQTGDEIISGVINLGSPLVIKATKEFYNSTMSQMLELVESASSNKAQTEKFITKFARIYTPIVIALAFLVATVVPLIIDYTNPAIWSRYIQAAASMLVISCPCAIVLSIPMAYFVSLGVASKNNILVKGGNYLDNFRKINTVVMDKTGTITKGNFEVSSINPTNDFTSDELLLLVKNAEYYSSHPIALAILKDRQEIDESNLKDYEEISGKGIKTLYKGKTLLVGNSKLMDDFEIAFSKVDTPFTIVYCAYDGKYAGSITIKDEIKETSLQAINNFYKNGVKSTYMLTGDNESIANVIAKEANISSYESNLLPLQKVDALKEIMKSSKNNVCYVGDGINDAACLTTANIGVSMGLAGSDLTIESSDAVIMNDDLNGINKTIKISKSNYTTVMVNLIFAISVKVIVMILNLIPTLPIDSYIMWLAIFADVGVTIICVLNSLRLMTRKY
ncbi:MAG: cadmium-translocating P-type ATPase [Bacilli bacterium]|nr:cadmium-translocating P-type ATPase [Bacilli bacterium]